jgi:hypothetical protein
MHGEPHVLTCIIAYLCHSVVVGKWETNVVRPGTTPASFYLRENVVRPLVLLPLLIAGLAPRFLPSNVPKQHLEILPAVTVALAVGPPTLTPFLLEELTSTESFAWNDS